MSSHEHRWPDKLINYKSKCQKCGQTLEQLIQKIQEKISINFLISTTTLDLFAPCISDDEAVVKDILE